MIKAMQPSQPDVFEDAQINTAQAVLDDEDKRQAFDDELELWILASST